MKIAKDTVVSIHYTLTDDDGKQLDSSEGKSPLVFLQGHQNIIPGLESELEGKEKGNKLIAKIAPAQAYGEHSPQLIQKVPKTNFPNPEEIAVGMQFQTMSEAGPVILTVTGLEAEEVTVDGNHPLAGVTLNFDVEVVEVREASEEEISHGQQIRICYCQTIALTQNMVTWFMIELCICTSI